MLFSEDIKDFLVDERIGEFGGTDCWGIYISAEPQEPNDAIMLYDDYSDEPMLTFSPNDRAIDRPQMTIRVRSASFPAASAKIAEIQDLLRHKAHFNINEHYYFSTTAITDVISLGRDDKDRHRLSFVLTAHRRKNN